MVVEECVKNQGLAYPPSSAIKLTQAWQLYSRYFLYPCRVSDCHMVVLASPTDLGKESVVWELKCNIKPEKLVSFCTLSSTARLAGAMSKL